MATAGGYWANLAELQKLVNDDFQKGVIAEIIEDGGFTAKLPIESISGTQKTYNREGTLPSGTYYGVGEEWTDLEVATYTQITATLKIHGGQYPIDKFVGRNYNNPNSIKAIAAQQSAKGLKRGLESDLVYGSVTANAKAFNGLQNLCAATQRVNNGSGSAGAPPSFHKLGTMIRLVRGKKPDLLLMSRALEQRLSESHLGGTTNHPVIAVTQDGVNIQPSVKSYDGIPVMRSDYMLMTEALSGGSFSASTGGSTGSIIALYFGRLEDGGVSLGLADSLFEKEEIQTLPNKDAGLFRIKSYLTLILGSTKALAIMDGCTDAPFAA